MMKKTFLFLTVLLATGLTACQNDDDNTLPAEAGGQLVEFTVSIPEALQTRADALAPATDALFGATSNSAMGGLTNLAAPQAATGLSGKYALRYQLVVYQKQADNSYRLVVPATSDAYYNTLVTKTDWADTKQTFKVRLTPDRQYRVVCWADFTLKDNAEADLHWNTADAFKLDAAQGAVITEKTAVDKQINDESRDAYYVQKDFTVGKLATDANDKYTETPAEPFITQTLVLRRPWAKVRVVTTDWSSLPGMPDTYKITYRNCKRFRDFNPLTAECASDQLAADATTVYTGNTISKDGREYALDYDMHVSNRTLTVDYLMTDKTQETAIQMLFQAYNSADMDTEDPTKGLVVSKAFTGDIPIKRNWLTTILGNLLTQDGTFTIKISEPFVDEYTEEY